MQINFLPAKDAYAEVGQTNPLRWYILHRSGGKAFDAQSHEFKCKDFFNDLVANYHGVPANPYGFQASTMKLNDEGIYVHLKYVTDKFATNLELVNKYAAQWDKPPVEVLHTDKDTRIVLIPRAYAENTFYMSLITYLIRIANVQEKLTDQSLKTHPSKSIDNPFAAQYDKVIEWGFKKLPVETFFYTGATPFPEQEVLKKNTGQAYTYTIHNCGVGTWMGLLTACKMI